MEAASPDAGAGSANEAAAGVGPGWSRSLAEALASMPRDLAEAVLASLPPDVVERILEEAAARDPYARLALMALRGCRR